MTEKNDKRVTFRPDPIDAFQGDEAEVTDRIGLSADPIAPPPHLKARVMSLFRAERGQNELAEGRILRPGISLVRTGDLPWENHSSPGVRMKPVFTGKNRRARSLLLELSPGSRFPDHTHEGVEEVFVIRGSFIVAGQLLREGDYCRSEPGTSDWEILSEEGALALVILTPGVSSGAPGSDLPTGP